MIVYFTPTLSISFSFWIFSPSLSQALTSGRRFFIFVILLIFFSLVELNVFFLKYLLWLRMYTHTLTLKLTKQSTFIYMHQHLSENTSSSSFLTCSHSPSQSYCVVSFGVNGINWSAVSERVLPLCHNTVRLSSCEHTYTLTHPLFSSSYSPFRMIYSFTSYLPTFFLILSISPQYMLSPWS